MRASCVLESRMDPRHQRRRGFSTAHASGLSSSASPGRQKERLTVHDDKGDDLHQLFRASPLAAAQILIGVSAHQERKLCKNHGPRQRFAIREVSIPWESNRGKRTRPLVASSKTSNLGSTDYKTAKDLGPACGGTADATDRNARRK